MDYLKEIARLKKENNKFRKALEDEAIDPDCDVLGKKSPKHLIGKELKIAADKKLKVRVITKYHNPQDKHMNRNEDCILEPAPATTKTEHWYYIGDSGDICLEHYADNDPVIEEFDEGIMQIQRAKGVKYS